MFNLVSETSELRNKVVTVNILGQEKIVESTQTEKNMRVVDVEAYSY